MRVVGVGWVLSVGAGRWRARGSLVRNGGTTPLPSSSLVPLVVRIRLKEATIAVGIRITSTYLHTSSTITNIIAKLSQVIS